MKRMLYKEFSGIRDESVRLLDVREKDEFEAVHVKGAEFWPLSQIQAGHLPKEDDRPTYVICRSGARSAAAIQYFEGAGWRECTNIEGGTIAALEMGDDQVERG